MCDCEGGLVRAICLDDAEVTRRGGGLQSVVPTHVGVNRRGSRQAAWESRLISQGSDRGTGKALLRMGLDVFSLLRK